jgi:hypothetical protein
MAAPLSPGGGVAVGIPAGGCLCDGLGDLGPGLEAALARARERSTLHHGSIRLRYAANWTFLLGIVSKNDRWTERLRRNGRNAMRRGC